MKIGLTSKRWLYRAISAVILADVLTFCCQRHHNQVLLRADASFDFSKIKRHLQESQYLHRQISIEGNSRSNSNNRLPHNVKVLQDDQQQQQQQQEPMHDDTSGGDMFGKTTREILKLRGFEAMEFNVRINAEFTLNLVRIINPLFRERYSDDASSDASALLKSSILFLHGATLASNYFLINSINARPRDFSRWTGQDLIKLNDLLVSDPSSKCLPLLMSNFGYDVWFLNRRSTLESQAASNQPHLQDIYQNFNRTYVQRTKLFDDLREKFLKYLLKPTQSLVSTIRSLSAKSHIRALLGGSTTELYLNELAYNFETILMPNVRQKTVDAGYWHFSLDEQAVFDLPKVIDFILAKTNRSQLDIVGHSLGGALPLMTMTLKPEYQYKIRHCFLFAPAVRPQLGFFEGPSRRLARKLERYLQSINGPLPPGIITPLMQTVFANICTTNRVQKFICTKYIDAYSGLGAEQLELNSGIFYAGLTTAGGHELVQLSQAIEKSEMHFYDYRNDEQNMLIYNQTSPPRYEIDKISNARLSIWVGNTDIMVPPMTIQALLQILRCPVELHYLNQPGGLFNHISYQFHKRVNSLVNIPIIHKLEKMEKERDWFRARQKSPS